jgi:casein kinase 1
MRIANYEYSDKIGQGTFGTIYKGYNIRTGEQVVIKTEPIDVEFSSIKHESTILNILYSKHCRNIPPTYWYGTIDTPPSRALVMPFYDESLDTFFLENQPTFVDKHIRVASNIMRSAISILESIHSKYVVHRDIKPANFMIHNDELILIDFGLASFYVDSEERHIRQSSTKKQHIIGTPKYASLHVHHGEEYSRRDDLMSIMYIGLFLLHGTGLWSNVPVYHFDGEKSDILNPLNGWLCEQKNLKNIQSFCSKWEALSEFAKQIYKLSFQERPSYRDYIELFAKTI